MNQNGLTFLTAMFMVMLIGIMTAFTGKSWTAIMKREREKELLFRGSQIKEAIENWNNPNYSANGVKRSSRLQLMDLKDLLQDKGSLAKLKYLPQHYATKLDDKDKSRKCAPDCPTLKIEEDPMTGKKWFIIRGNVVNGVPTPVVTGVQGAGVQGAGVQGAGVQGGAIIGVASTSDEEPFRTDFKDTALENMGVPAPGTIPVAPGSTPTPPSKVNSDPTGTTTPPGSGKMTKYSEWQFIYDPKNDHKKIYRAYHEGW